MAALCSARISQPGLGATDNASRINVNVPTLALGSFTIASGVGLTLLSLAFPTPGFRPMRFVRRIDTGKSRSILQVLPISGPRQGVYPELTPAPDGRPFTCTVQEIPPPKWD